MCVVYFILIMYYLYRQTINKFSRHFYDFDFSQIIRFVETFVMCYAFFGGGYSNTVLLSGLFTRNQNPLTPEATDDAPQLLPKQS